MQLLLDTNVLVDVFAHRPGWENSQRVLEWCQAPSRGAWVTWPTVATLAYLLEAEGNDSEAIRAKIRMLQGWVDVCPADSSTLDLALRYQFDDFEDALQCAFAASAGLDRIITRNTADFVGSLVPCMTPENFLAQDAPASHSP